MDDRTDATRRRGFGRKARIALLVAIPAAGALGLLIMAAAMSHPANFGTSKAGKPGNLMYMKVHPWLPALNVDFKSSPGGGGGKLTLGLGYDS